MDDTGTTPGDGSTMGQSNHHILVSIVVVFNHKVWDKDKVSTSRSTRTVFSPDRGRG